MKTKAAVMWNGAGPFEISELELDDPKAGEVLIRYEYAGMCHSDEHLRHGDLAFTPPMVGGHEGSGVIEAVGPDVTRVKPGDHIVTSWMPMCRECRFCLEGHSNLCLNGQYLLANHAMDGTCRLHGRGQDLGPGVDQLGTFSQWNVIPESCCVKVDPDLPLDIIAVTACGVPTGWGSAVNAAEVRAGDVVVVYGVGGVGMNAVQGARHAGASVIVAVDPFENKHAVAKQLGATHAFTDPAEAHAFVIDHTWGIGADSAIITVSLVNPEVVQQAFAVIRRRGVVVVTALSTPGELTIQVPGIELTLYEKRIVGSLFGSGAPHLDILRMIDLWKGGHLQLEPLINRRYKLDDINQGYDDLLKGEVIRGIIEIEHGTTGAAGAASRDQAPAQATIA
jgi:alcohol dehydrogenase (nicotinoprotein)